MAVGWSCPAGSGRDKGGSADERQGVVWCRVVRGSDGTGPSGKEARAGSDAVVTHGCGFATPHLSKSEWSSWFTARLYRVCMSERLHPVEQEPFNAQAKHTGLPDTLGTSTSLPPIMAVMLACPLAL